MDYPMFEHRGVECWELEWHPSTGEIIARGLTYEYGLDIPDVEVIIPVPDLPERFADAVDAWCVKYGIEHPTTLEDVLRRTARGPFCVGDQRGGRSGDEALCEQFGTTLEEVEADVERYERGDFTEFAFADSVDGKPEGLVDSILEEAEE